ncbi:MAG: hypothetical protein AAB092_09210, partial [Chloroflexota bacterium]
VIHNEKDVEELLVKPWLRTLGWVLDRSNCQVWIELDRDKAEMWNYSSRRMCRDYVLGTASGFEMHIEAKHRWAGWKLDLPAVLERFSREDYADSEKAGPIKDLALLLWGVRSRGGRRAAVVDESQLAIFEWTSHWTIPARAIVTDDSFPEVAARWLSPRLN